MRDQIRSILFDLVSIERWGDELALAEHRCFTRKAGAFREIDDPVSNIRMRSTDTTLGGHQPHYCVIHVVMER